jgi:hypothetical protein
MLSLAAIDLSYVLKVSIAGFVIYLDRFFPMPLACQRDAASRQDRAAIKAAEKSTP